MWIQPNILTRNMLFSPYTHFSLLISHKKCTLHSSVSAKLFLFFRILIAFIILGWILVRNTLQRWKLLIWVWMIIWWSAKTLSSQVKLYQKKESDTLSRFSQLISQLYGVIRAKHLHFNTLWLPSMQWELGLSPWTLVFPSSELD